MCVLTRFRANRPRVQAPITPLLGASWQALISRWIFGDPKIIKNVDLSVPGSVGRIRKFYDFSRFSQKVSSRSWGHFLWFCVFSDIKNKWLFSGIEQKWCRSVQISGLLRGPPALPWLRVQSSNIIDDVYCSFSQRGLAIHSVISVLSSNVVSFLMWKSIVHWIFLMFGFLKFTDLKNRNFLKILSFFF